MLSQAAKPHEFLHRPKERPIHLSYSTRSIVFSGSALPLALAGALKTKFRFHAAAPLLGK
jgi:hypothetical protein